MKALYGLTIALSAVLLFSVEPMVARALLPQLGGSSAVWISALAFFQLVLLLGYAYAVWLTTALSRSRAAWLAHLALLAVALLSTLANPTITWRGPADHPQLRLFALLSLAIGLPFLTLSTTAPLLQAWYAQRERTAVPYRLFALSNLASLAALLAYPTLVEPFSDLSTQFTVWRVFFFAYVLLAASLTLRRRSAAAASEEPLPAPTGVMASALPRRVRVLWFALPAVASMQLAAVTAHLSQDVASLPLLWVVPLAAYLLSFVLAFELPRLYSRALVIRLLAVLLFSLGYFLMQTGVNVPIVLSITLFTTELLFAAWFCHAELFALRPQGSLLTPRFYLYMAAGGAVGTLAIAVVSPWVTDSNLDLPFSFLLTAVLLLVVTWPEGKTQRALWSTGAALAVYLLVSMRAAYAHDALFRDRNFYGSIRVKQTQLPPQAFLSRTLFNGAIQHGMQWFSTEFHHAPLTYYAPDSGVGLALDHCCDPAQPRRIGVIGLGAGTLAAYGHPGDQFRFYEINPIVIDVAQHLFTYTRDTPASITVVPGDARLSLAAELPQRFNVLVIDAFTGDSIPTHLLTREAFTLYLRHLVPGGVLAFHISNQYLDLAPVLARLAASTRTSGNAPLLAREVDTDPDEARGESRSAWVLITANPQFFTKQALANAQTLQLNPRVRLWTDQYSSLLPILRWTGRH